MTLPDIWTIDYPFDRITAPVLVTELNMRFASNLIREKDQWWLKYKDPKIARKWKRELLTMNLENRGERRRLADNDDDDDGVSTVFGTSEEEKERGDEELVEENGDDEEEKKDEVDYLSANRTEWSVATAPSVDDTDSDDEEYIYPNGHHADDDDFTSDRDSDSTDDDYENSFEPFDDHRLSVAQVDYVFKELDLYAEIRNSSNINNNNNNNNNKTNGMVHPFGQEESLSHIERAIDGTWRSDDLIPPELKSRLKQLVQDKLENVAEDLKDWHPGSNQQVLDLVHPSLFPAISGLSRLRSKDQQQPSQPTILEFPPCPKEIDSKYWSKKYQWLPTDFEMNEFGKSKTNSYINNLHPVYHQELYPVMEQILDCFLPLFENCLGELSCLKTRTESYNRLDHCSSQKNFNRIQLDPNEWYVTDKGYSDFKHLDYPREWYQDYLDSRPIQAVPIPTQISAFELKPYPLKNKTLQVMIKLANIVLTPENPIYPGGSWHIEGMANERIIASGIYYYDCENLTTSRLKFRMAVQEPDYEQEDSRGVSAMYGLYNGSPLVQDLDGIVTKQDRCIVFPNLYQHQVQPFELLDKTKMGVRKILVFFLVDPERPILSTTDVPQQRKGWKEADGMMKDVEEKLPTELVQMVEDLLDFPIRLEDAKMEREKLMKERKFFVKENTTKSFERPFSLCEH